MNREEIELDDLYYETKTQIVAALYWLIYIVLNVTLLFTIYKDFTTDFSQMSERGLGGVIAANVILLITWTLATHVVCSIYGVSFRVLMPVVRARYWWRKRSSTASSSSIHRDGHICELCKAVEKHHGSHLHLDEPYSKYEVGTWR